MQHSSVMVAGSPQAFIPINLTCTVVSLQIGQGGVSSSLVYWHMHTKGVV